MIMRAASFSTTTTTTRRRRRSSSSNDGCFYCFSRRRRLGDSRRSSSSLSLRRKSKVGEDEEEVASASSSSSLSSLKKELLNLVAASRKANTIDARAKKREILEAVAKLENEARDERELDGDVQGSWALVYSTDDDENKAMFMLDDANDKLVKDILDALYKFFFAFAAPLAGGFSGAETKKKERGGGELFRSIRNEQIVDLTRKRVENFVDLEILGRKTRVVVRGEIKPLDEFNRKVQVTFTDWSFDDFVTLPLPRPTGGLENTYCDETMRISRGSRGGVFITTRLKKSEQQR
jgi:hypothetical protein